MAQPRQFLGGLTPRDFLRDYWQKKPLLIRQGCPQAAALMNPDELGGLALEHHIESRLVQQQPGATPAGDQWTLKHGPLASEQFTELPNSHWTLLVQAVDQYLPEVRRLLALVDFIPNWRVDDIMVSYAADQGGVGPHFDHYDVFLIQGQGRREWRLGQQCDEHTPCLPDQPLRVLTEFEQHSSWVLSPGDVLYVPPGMAHWGIAQGPCMSYSIGFRAPAIGDLLAEYAHDLAESFSQHDRYSDPDLAATPHPGKLDHQVIEQLHQRLQAALTDPERFADWLAAALSTSKYDTSLQPMSPAVSLIRLQAAIGVGGELWLDESSRCLYREDSDGNIIGYFNGLPMPFMSRSEQLLFRQLADHRRILPEHAVEAATRDGATLLRWLNDGWIYLLDEEDDEED